MFWLKFKKWIHFQEQTPPLEPSPQKVSGIAGELVPGLENPGQTNAMPQFNLLGKDEPVTRRNKRNVPKVLKNK